VCSRRTILNEIALSDATSDPHINFSGTPSDSAPAELDGSGKLTERDAAINFGLGKSNAGADSGKAQQNKFAGCRRRASSFHVLRPYLSDATGIAAPARTITGRARLNSHLVDSLLHG